MNYTPGANTVYPPCNADPGPLDRPLSATEIWQIPAMTDEQTAAWYEAWHAMNHVRPMDRSTRKYADTALKAFRNLNPFA